jgi:hypothetical protein
VIYASHCAAAMRNPAYCRGLSDRDAVRNWLRVHHIPIEDAPVLTTGAGCG